jgi:hypothetical protein
MAQIYAGERSRIDASVLEAVRGLPDDYWVFAEFTLRRNVDWLIIREAQVGPKGLRPSAIIVTEVKRVSAPLRGDTNRPWEALCPPDSWQEITPSNRKDLNYYWQAVNTANALRAWLWNHQRLFLPPQRVRPESDFKLWPDLLLLGPCGTAHQLPLAPESRFGRWFFGLDAWLDHVRAWSPREGIALSAAELREMPRLFGLERLHLDPLERAAAA